MNSDRPPSSTPPPRGPLLIVGASTRAAARSAVRGGYRPICLDCFADEDLRQIAEVIPCDDYPAGIVDAVVKLPSCPWMYTGALENQPRLIAALASNRPLLGNGPDSLQFARDPFHLCTVLAAAGLPALELRAESDPPPRDGRWICKPLRSGAGRGICVWDDVAATPREPHYFQRRARGKNLSGLFLADRERVRLIGISEQLSGWEAAHAVPFAYCGSIGPVAVPELISDRIREIGAACARACNLRGLFGIDCILENNQPMLLEINPRYPASAELFESLAGVSLVSLHADACSRGICANVPEVTADSCLSIGKLILYAPRALLAPDLIGHLPANPVSFELPEFADIPRPGSPINRGDPICTLFARADSIDGCRVALAQRAAECYREWHVE
ncbi:MAG TPA: ATP-grasp domain-containing protein [Planctomycetaceae bacterium]|nr:ATP-grasp domain-containing protein [Planctomycetaceae bacterium]